MTRSRPVAGAALVLALGAAALAWRFGPAVAVTAVLAVPPAERWFPARTIPVEDVVIRDGLLSLRADLYRPARPRAALLLVHGLSRAGRHHPELERVARLLARNGLLVLVPQFEGLASFSLTGREVDEIRLALRHLQAAGRAVGVAGFSFGAGPTLLAAAEVPGLSVVGSFGGYADLRNVITFVTTGVHAFRGQRYVQPHEEYNRWKLLALLGALVEDAGDRGRLGAIAARRLANPSDDTAAVEQELGAEGRAVLALVLNRRAEAVAPLIDRLPAPARQALDRLSPLGVVARLPGRLLIAHGEGDDSIPFTESLRLAEAAGGRARLAILHSFNHTGPQGFWASIPERTADGWRLVGLVDDLL